MMSASATYESTARGGMNGGGVVTTTVGNIGGIIHSNTTSSTVGDALGEFMCYDSGTDAAFNGYVAGGNQQMPAQCALLTTITTPGGGGGVNVGSFVNGVGGGDSSIPSSTSSSHTRIPGLNSHGHYNTDDSGLSSNTSGISDRTTTMLMPMGGGGNVMYGSPDMSYNRNEELTEDLEPMTRDRCNTWPMRRPTLDINAQTSPLIHDRIEEEPFGSNENVNDEDGILSSPTAGNDLGLNDYLNELSPTSPSRHDSGDNRDGGISPPTSQKKSTTRRNAWGNMSYADLITQAILSSPEKRLTLSQVYEWMVQNVPYFRDKGDSNSSAGWKNSIRHNLSLHSRFMRIQNEGAGKSSWWVINPDAKPGRNPRRRASTMEASSKAAIEKKRRGARKRVEMGMRTGTITSGASSMLGSQASIISDLYECDELNSNFDTFRPRTQSNISIAGGVSSRVSPSADANFDEFDFAPWMDSSTPHPQMNELMNRTDQMRLDSQDPPPPYRRLDGIAKSIPPPPQGQLIAVKAECVEVKSDIGIAPPPSYQELNAVNGSMHMQNPLLRNQVQQHQQMPSPLNKPNMAANNVQILQQPPQQQQYFPSNSGGTLYTVQQQTLPPGTWVNTANNQQITIVNSTGNGITQQLPHQQQMVQQQQQAHHQMMCGGQPPMQMHQQHVVVSASTAGIQTSTANLPYDLQNLMPDQSLMDLDMEAVLRHELAQTNNQLSFDL